MARRLRIAGLALVLVAAACGGDDEGGGVGITTPATTDTGRGSTTTGAYPQWTVTELDEGYEIDAGSYRVQVSTADGLRLDAVDVDGAPLVIDPPDGGVFAVAGGVEHPVVAVTDTILGVDHLTFEVSFGVVGPGRVEMAADGPDAVAVRVSLDAHPEVTEHRMVLGDTGTP